MTVFEPDFVAFDNTSPKEWVIRKQVQQQAGQNPETHSDLQGQATDMIGRAPPSPNHPTKALRFPGTSEHPGCFLTCLPALTKVANLVAVIAAPLCTVQ